MVTSSTIRSIAKSFIPSPVRRSARERVARFQHQGTTLQCPMCHAWVDHLLPHGQDHDIIHQLDIVGGGRRQHATCPVCLSTDRERLIYLYLLWNTRLFFGEKAKLLHMAPESMLGRVLSRQKSLDYVSADLQAPDVMLHIDLCDIPLEDEVFDVILCNHVMEHIPEDGLAMRELHRVLKPGGFAILQTPIAMDLKTTYEDPSITSPQEREIAYGQWDHVRIYGRDYAHRLADAGFQVDLFNWKTDADFLENPGMTHGLNTEEVLYIAHKT